MTYNRQSRFALPELRLATHLDTAPIELPWSRGLSSALPFDTLRRLPRRRRALPLTPMPALPS